MKHQTEGNFILVASASNPHPTHTLLLLTLLVFWLSYCFPELPVIKIGSEPARRCRNFKAIHSCLHVSILTCYADALITECFCLCILYESLQRRTWARSGNGYMVCEKVTTCCVALGIPRSDRVYIFSFIFFVLKFRCVVFMMIFYSLESFSNI